MDPDFDKNIKKLLAGTGVEIGDDDNMDDADLHAELEAIMNGGSRSKARQAPQTQAKKQKTAPGLQDPSLDMNQIQRMLNGFDLENSKDDDDDINVDESDLMEFLGQVGHNDNEEEEDASQPQAPPPMAKAPVIPSRQLSPPLIPSRPAPTVVPVQVQTAIPPRPQQMSSLDQIKARQMEYKRAALKAKNEGNKEEALKYLRLSKEFDTAIQRVEAGENVDLSTIPPSLGGVPAVATAVPKPQPSQVEQRPIQLDELPDVSQEEAAKIFNAPTSAGTVLEALQQRLDKFKATQNEAQAANNSSKVRRLGRIVKQYETAIKAYKSGKKMTEAELAELPCPPGFPDFPKETSGQKKPAPAPAPAPVPKAAPVQPKPQPAAAPPAGAATSSGTQKPQLKRGTSTIGDKTMRFLVERQRLFKQAALEAYKRKEVEQAKEYMRQAKGFDPLIEATINGLPIDATSIPTPPQMTSEEADFVVIDSNEAPAIPGTGQTKFYTGDEREELFRELERDLLSQIEMCNRNKEFFLKLGNAQNSTKFETFAVNSRKDLTMLRVRWKNGDNVPSFKYETRTYSCVVANQDVGTQEMMVEVLNGIDFPGKQEIDTYVRIEFLFPSTVTTQCSIRKLWSCLSVQDEGGSREKAQIKKTKTVYDTTNPSFNEKILFEINRESKSLMRILKRHPLRVDLYSRGGFLRSDPKVGSILIDLKELEKKCTIHECFPLTDGKKQLPHGALEIKVKIREPLLAKQIEEIKERWIVFA